jgi:hypothetical protein
MRHAFEGLCRVVSAWVVMGGETHWARLADLIAPMSFL